MTNHQSALSINKSFQKKVKRRNEDDNDTDDNEPNEILSDNDK